MTSSAVNPMRAAARAARPWVMRTALGPPVDPEVKMSRKRSSGAGTGFRPAGVAIEALPVAGAVAEQHPVRVQAEVEAVEQAALRRVGDDQLAVGP